MAYELASLGMTSVTCFKPVQMQVLVQLWSSTWWYLHSCRTPHGPCRWLTISFATAKFHVNFYWDSSILSIMIYYNHHNRFTALFPGPRGSAGARRELLDFMVQGKINRGRHTDHPAGRHSIRTNQCPRPPSPHTILHTYEYYAIADAACTKFNGKGQKCWIFARKKDDKSEV